MEIPFKWMKIGGTPMYGNPHRRSSATGTLSVTRVTSQSAEWYASPRWPVWSNGPISLHLGSLGGPIGRLRATGQQLDQRCFHRRGYPNSWMLDFMENPRNGWFRGTPISGNHHVWNGTGPRPPRNNTSAWSVHFWNMEYAPNIRSFIGKIHHSSFSSAFDLLRPSALFYVSVLFNLFIKEGRVRQKWRKPPVKMW